MPIPQEILKLVERFDSQREAYQSGKYNEAQIRAEFIDPLFKALGWDIHNEQGNAEAYKDVIHEDAIKIGGATEAPDLCFRIGGTRKFFVECKKPSVNIKDDVHPAYQLRRYAWSARLPLSILTDFQELAVYDCRAKPNKTDTSAIGRLMYFTSNQFAEKWDEFAAIFSREAVLKGSFDKFAESTKGKKGTASVDDAFLGEIERWRDMLARNIAMRNEKLSQRELNFSVQRIIDRIVFLRICEDRGIEPYGRLMALRNGERVYPRLCEFFQRADERYNSGLFHFQSEKDRPEAPDELTLKLKLDDKVLKDIVGNLYYPESPYEFSVLPADILGQVYERFLGKVIRLTAGHQAKVEDKPEVRKAGGVYYTPTYIVDYIVKNTVGKLLEGKTPKQAAKLKILDPACGSGSFLLGAYQLLLDWHLVQYMKEPENWTKGREPKLYQHHKGGWKLTTAERKRILLNNIYGVDIDSQAVEVTKLSLLLKVLEGESQETITKQFELFQQRALPDLGSNIKCGNSLIGPDFYKDRQGELFGEDEMYRINAFDWQAEFAEIFKAGGFDVVIGNPPYVRQESLGAMKEYLAVHYTVFHGMADLYAYFLERGISILRQGGLFGMIVANKWMRANYGEPLRRFLKQHGLEKIIDFGDLPVFEQATTYPCILIVRNSQPHEKFSVVNVTNLDFSNLEEYVAAHCHELEPSKLEDAGWSLAGVEIQRILAKIRAAGKPLGEYVNGKIYRGVLTGLNEAFVIDASTRKRLIAEDKKCAILIKPFLAGKDIKRYVPPSSDRFLIFTRRGINIDEYPSVKSHLLKYKEQLLPKPKNWNGPWKGRKPGSYQWCEIQDTVGYYAEFEKPKILLPDISKRGNFTFDENEQFYCVNTSYIIPTNDKYLLGILNSNLIAFFYAQLSSAYRGGYLRFIYQYLIQIPIPETMSPTTKGIASLVDQMLDLHKRQAAAKTDHERTLLERQIFATDREIDRLVYELYELTEEEIKILEVATKSSCNRSRKQNENKTDN